MRIFKAIGRYIWLAIKAIGHFVKKTCFSLVKFFVLTVREMKKVRWPNKEKMKEASQRVLTFLFLFGLYIVFDNYIIGELLLLIGY